MDQEFTAQFGLTPLKLSDKPMFDSFYRRLNEPLAEHSFAAAFTWGSTLSLAWKLIEEHLCLFATEGGDLTLFMPPMPSPDARPGDFQQAVLACFEAMDAYNDRFAHRALSAIEYIPAEMAPLFQGVAPSELVIEPFAHDYIYATNLMIELNGNALKSKRHARGKFMRTFPAHRTELFSNAHRDGCRDLLDKWWTARTAEAAGKVNACEVELARLLERDLKATARALEHWQELELKGLVLYVDDAVVGFTLGEALSPRQASILIEKTDANFPGAPQFIFSEFCRQCWANFPECNVGDDWGIPALKFTKESYRPVRLQPKLVVKRRLDPSVAS